VESFGWSQQMQSQSRRFCGGSLPSGGGTIAAGGNVTLQAAKATSTVDSNSSGSDHHGSYAEALHTVDDKLTATTLQSGDSLNIVSGKNINVTGSTVDLTKGNALLMAAGNVNVGAATETHEISSNETHSHSGVASHTSAVNRVDETSTYADGSSISADGVTVVSGKDIDVTGSSIVGMNNVALAAKGSVNITAATDTYQDTEFHDLKHSGFSGTGGLGVSYGSSEQKDQYNGTSITQSQSRSTVGSVAGNVAISAGNDVHIGGSDIVAGKASGDTNGATGNIAIQAQNITIDPSQDDSQSHDQQTSHSSGVSVAITGTPLDTVRNVRQASSSGSGFQRTEGVSNELLASALDVPSVAVSFGHSSSSSTTDASSLTNTGSTLRGGGNVSLTASGGGLKDANGNPLDGDITLTGSTVTAGGIASFSANRNVIFQASTDQLRQSMESSSSSTQISLATPTQGDMVRWVSGGPNSGGVSSSPYNASRMGSDGNAYSTQQTATVVTGNSVVVTSKTGDIDVVGSGISGTQSVNLIASQGAINVLAGTDTSTSHQESSSHQVGSLGSNGTGTGYSVGVASSHSVEDSAGQTQSAIRSQIASQNGNVTLDAKQDVTVSGSDLSAGKDLTLIGKNVLLDAGTDAFQDRSSASSSQFGETVALGGVIGNAVATVNQSMAQASHTKNKRLAALDGAEAALAVYGAANATSNAQLFKVSVSVGGGSSHSSSQSSSVTNTGSTLSAGGDVTVVAAGSGAQDATGHALDGDITSRGTSISGQNVTLNAVRDINLQSARDTTQQTGSTSSSGANVGVGLALGGQQNGFTIELAANASKGAVNGSSETNRDTQITASNTLSMTSGRDTNLRGAEVSGDTVDANVGRDLNIQSPQDANTYRSSQSSAGFQASICVPPICYGQTVSGTVSVSDQRIKDNFQSVDKQSGIYAGNGGFNVQVGNHTQLDGGVIASTASADKNALSTQTFGFTNLQNTASYSGTGISFSASGGAGTSSKGTGVMFTTPVQTGSSTPGPSNSRGMGPIGFGVAGTSGSVSGTTYAAVSPGAITVRGDASTGHDSTAGLSRDAAHANGSVLNTFNAQSVQDDLAIQQLTGQVGMQVVGDLATHMKDRASAEKTAADQALADAQQSGDGGAIAQAKADDDAAALQVALWGNDGVARVGLHMAVAGLGAAAGGGSVPGALAGTLAGDYAAAAANEAFGDTLGGKLLTNIVSGTAGALAGGAVGGSAGAVSGANGALSADLYNRQLHPDEKKWIKDHAADFAKLRGISVDAAVQELTAQADRQVQNGSPGAWDQNASAFLDQAHGLLAVDPSCPSCGPGYTFYATPAQKAAPNMYAGYYPNGAGLNMPSASAITTSATRDQANRNLMGAGVIAGATGAALLAGAPVAASIGALGYAAIGGTTGGGMDAAGQYGQSGTVRPVETGFAAMTGALAGPIGANVNFMNNVLLGAATSSVNTAFNNAYYGESNSLSYSGALGALGGAGGYLIGTVTTLGLGQILKPFIYENLNPTIPALLQPRVSNPVSGLAGATSGGISSGTTSFVPSQPAPK
jgi:filamentous hemagglutinin